MILNHIKLNLSLILICMLSISPSRICTHLTVGAALWINIPPLKDTRVRPAKTRRTVKDISENWSSYCTQHVKSMKLKVFFSNALWLGHVTMRVQPWISSGAALSDLNAWTFRLRVEGCPQICEDVSSNTEENYTLVLGNTNVSCN